MQDLSWQNLLTFLKMTLTQLQKNVGLMWIYEAESWKGIYFKTLPREKEHCSLWMFNISFNNLVHVFCGIEYIMPFWLKSIN